MQKKNQNKQTARAVASYRITYTYINTHKNNLQINSRAIGGQTKQIANSVIKGTKAVQ